MVQAKKRTCRDQCEPGSKILACHVESRTRHKPRWTLTCQHPCSDAEFGPPTTTGKWGLQTSCSTILTIGPFLEARCNVEGYSMAILPDCQPDVLPWIKTRVDLTVAYLAGEFPKMGTHPLKILGKSHLTRPSVRSMSRACAFTFIFVPAHQITNGFSPPYPCALPVSSSIQLLRTT